MAAMSPTAKPAERLTPVKSQSIVELVLSQLEELFIAGGFRPGDRLNEVALSQAMRVSRSSLREAARKLEQRGWLISRPNRGFFVRSFTESEVTHIYEARLCLESFAVRKALGGLTRQQRDTLQDRFNALSAAAGTDAVIDPILTFHRAIVGLTENQILLSSYDALAMDTKVIVNLVGGVQANPGEFQRRNRRIFEAMMAQNVEEAVTELTDYLTMGLGEVMDFLRQSDDPPEGGTVSAPSG